MQGKSGLLNDVPILCEIIELKGFPEGKFRKIIKYKMIFGANIALGPS